MTIEKIKSPTRIDSDANQTLLENAQKLISLMGSLDSYLPAFEFVTGYQKCIGEYSSRLKQIVAVATGLSETTVFPDNSMKKRFKANLQTLKEYDAKLDAEIKSGKMGFVRQFGEFHGALLKSASELVMIILELTNNKEANPFILLENRIINIEAIRLTLKDLKTRLPQNKNPFNPNINAILINLIEQTTIGEGREGLSKLMAFIYLYFESAVAKSKSPQSTKTLGLLLDKNILEAFANILKIDLGKFDKNNNCHIENLANKVCDRIKEFLVTFNPQAIELYNTEAKPLFSDYFNHNRIKNKNLWRLFCNPSEVSLDSITGGKTDPTAKAHFEFFPEEGLSTAKKRFKRIFNIGDDGLTCLPD